MTDQKKVPFGTWPSPISPTVTAQRTRLYDVQWSPDGRTLVWLEGRSARGVLVASTLDEAPRDLTAAHSVRARVGYGNISAGRLYKQRLPHGQPEAITPGFGAAAAPTVSRDGRRLLFVHTYEDQDSIGLLDMSEKRWPAQLVQGADFYMSLCWHPDGERFAWIEWDHPNMPWDGTRLQLGTLGPEGHSLTQQTQLAGGPQTAISQPAFSSDGRFLSYITPHDDLPALVL